MAPPGGHVVIVQKVVDVDYPAVADWSAHKAAIERDVLDYVERLIPGFRDRIVVKLTRRRPRRSGSRWNRHGAMLGWEMSPEQLGVGRPDIQSPVEGLYFTGHWTRPGGGITPVLMSAVRAAEMVTGRAGRIVGRRSAANAEVAVA